MNSETTSLISILASMVVAGGVTLMLYAKGNFIEKQNPMKLAKPTLKPLNPAPKPVNPARMY